MREKVSRSSGRSLFSLMNLWIALVFLADGLLFKTLVGGAPQQEEVSENFALAAYLPDYRIATYMEQQLLHNSSTDVPPLLTDLILFSLQPHPKGFLGGCCLQSDHYMLAQKFREQLYATNEKRLTMWVTIGGSGRSDAFSLICGDEKLRKRLIQSAINLCKKHSIQGIDLDYTPRSIKDRDQYVIFLQEAIQQWHDAGLLVSMSTMFHPVMTFVMSQVYQQMDRFHVMTYDMISRNTSDNNDLYHASLSKTKTMLEALLQLGAGSMELTPKKILLGIPFYARHLQSPGNVMTFGEIYDAIVDEKGNDQQSIDWSTLHSWNGFEWESGRRIRDKVELAKNKGLGGIFFWEVGQDKVLDPYPRGVLLEAAAAAVRSELAADHPTLGSDDDNDEL